jgi:hypothetical protein
VIIPEESSRVFDRVFDRTLHGEVSGSVAESGDDDESMLEPG